MLTRYRVQRMNWFGEASLVGVGHSFRHVVGRRSVSSSWVGYSKKSLAKAKLEANWKSYALMLLGVGAILAAFTAQGGLHPWTPVLLGWVGGMGVIRGFIG
ncbi:MAG: hypothetical protein H6Q00_3504 [Holophagaceae bacterium]|nr:hypothetical protein [Holophagaceae bacterium]